MRDGRADVVPLALAQLQQFMQSALLQQAEGPDDALIARYIAPTDQLDPVQHLAIYQRAYFARLLQCMQGQFKGLSHALGPDLFRDFAREYLRAHPSHSPTLAHLGAGFADYLQQNRPDAHAAQQEAWIDFMVELADFEWTLYSLFDAPGAEEQGYATLAQQHHPALRLQPCLALRQYRFPVGAYYQQVADGQDPDFPLPQQVQLALVRTHYRLGIFSLQPAQYALLSCWAQADGTLAQALATTAEQFGEAINSLAPLWLRGWLQAGFLVLGSSQPGQLAATPAAAGECS